MEIEIIQPPNKKDFSDKKISLRVPVIGDTKKAYRLANTQARPGATQREIMFDTATFLLQEIFMCDGERLTLADVDDLDLPFLMELGTSLFPLLAQGLTPLLQSISSTD